MKNDDAIKNSLLLERYELKYTIPPAMVAPIADYISVYCSPDPYSQESSNGYYRVNNLYLDTPAYLFMRMRLEGAENRFNMRVRSYGNDPGLPYFVEIKQKINMVVRKYRARVTDPEWYRVYTEPGVTHADASGDTIEARHLKMFERMVYSYNAAPKVFTQYLRNAWVSDVDVYARVTFDVNLRYMEENNYNLIPREHEMVSCDPEIYFDPGCNVILELKCLASAVPLWMIDLIRIFQLERRSFSKYLTGARELFERNSILSLSRMAGRRSLYA